MIFLYFLMSTWGLTHLLVSSKILEGFRNWLLIYTPFIGRMLECYQCTGFWTSLFLYFIFPEINFGSISFNIKEFEFNFDFLISSLIGSGFSSYASVLFSSLVKVKK